MTKSPTLGGPGRRCDLTRSVALLLGVWVVVGHPPMAVVLATAVVALTAACLIGVVAFRTGRRDGRGPGRSFGRAVWEALKLLFSLP